MMDSPAKILTSYDIKGLRLSNRLAVAPMTRVSATGAGHVTPAMVRYYERFARGGFGLVFSEGIYTDQTFSQGYPFQPGITDPEQARAWRTVTDRIHAHEGAVFSQLMHAGALSQSNPRLGQTAGPSALRPKGEQLRFYHGAGQYPVPKAMTDEDIADAIAGFVQSARLSIEVAGFDGVEVHSANGYLLDQFLTDYSNQRLDRWGGTTQDRMGLTLEVLKQVRKAVDQVPLGVRISQGKVNDFEHKWPGREHDADVIFGSLNDAGVDFIHVTEFEAWKPAFSGSDASLVKFARKYAPDVSIIANGGLHQAAKADIAFQDGADLIALGKGALANPDLPNRIAARRSIASFDASILGPIANIKDSELAF